MGAAPGDLLTREGLRERYKVLVMGLHPDKVGGGAAPTEAFGLLHSASRVLEGRLGNQGERAPKREPPLTPAPRLRMRPPPPPQTPTATAVRQVPPALRKWLRKNVLGAKAGEALTSPLTYSHGIFSEPPSLHERTVGVARRANWGWAVDNVTSASWRQTPWPHDVLVTVEELEEGELDALVEKASWTAKAGRRVFILLGTAKEWKSVINTGARCMLQIPPGGVPWGDAVGWPDAAGAVESDGKAKRTHSWGLDGWGRPTVATGEPAAGLGRASRRHQQQQTGIRTTL